MSGRYPAVFLQGRQQGSSVKNEMSRYQQMSHDLLVEVKSVTCVDSVGCF